MKIALDAMGGDYAPATNVEGTIEALREDRTLSVVLVGDENGNPASSPTTLFAVQDKLSHLPAFALAWIAFLTCLFVLQKGRLLNGKT